MKEIRSRRKAFKVFLESSSEDEEGKSIPNKVLGASVLKRHRQDESVDTETSQKEAKPSESTSSSSTIKNVTLEPDKQMTQIVVVVQELNVHLCGTYALTGTIGNTNYVILLPDIGLDPNTRGKISEFKMTMAATSSCKGGWDTWGWIMGGSRDGNKISWVKWDGIISSLGAWGLNIGSLRAKNLALLSKWWWRFRKEGGVMRCKIKL
nr:RNA-directed DNA polymerase, eukaryota, reverse transcriptase zinc-binding domain protein [Tanacetum cinerariifolium]